MEYQFVLLNCTNNELIGIFKEKTDAEYYYLKNCILERLKIYMTKTINNSDCMNNIADIRDYDNLIGKIEEVEKEDNNFSHSFNLYLNLAHKLLNRYYDDESVSRHFNDEVLEDKKNKNSPFNYKLFRFGNASYEHYFIK